MQVQPDACIRQHTSAYVSIRQWQVGRLAGTVGCLHTSAYVSIRQHTPEAEVGDIGWEISGGMPVSMSPSFSLSSAAFSSCPVSCATPRACQYLYFCTSRARKLSTKSHWRYEVLSSSVSGLFLASAIAIAASHLCREQLKASYTSSLRPHTLVA